MKAFRTRLGRITRAQPDDDPEDGQADKGPDNGNCVGPGTVVSYRNGDTLNGWRINLVVVNGADFVTAGFGRGS